MHYRATSIINYKLNIGILSKTKYSIIERLLIENILLTKHVWKLIFLWMNWKRSLMSGRNWTEQRKAVPEKCVNIQDESNWIILWINLKNTNEMKKFSCETNWLRRVFFFSGYYFWILCFKNLVVYKSLSGNIYIIISFVLMEIFGDVYW